MIGNLNFGIGSIVKLTQRLMDLAIQVMREEEIIREINENR